MTTRTYGGLTAAELTTLIEDDRSSPLPWSAKDGVIYDARGIFVLSVWWQTADLVVAASSALPDLIAALARLQARNEYLEAELTRYSDWRENVLSAHRDLWDVEL